MIFDSLVNYQLSGYVVFFLLISYMTVASVLLMNLLIAMLSNTFDRLQADTDCIWKFQHYSLVCYHLTRPCLPPPLIIFAHLSRCCLVIFGKYFKIDWIKQKYIQMKNREKFRRNQFEERIIFLFKIDLFRNCN